MRAFSVTLEAISPGIPTMPMSEISPELEGRAVILRHKEENRESKALFVRLDANNLPPMIGDSVQAADLAGTEENDPLGGFNTVLTRSDEDASTDRLLWIDASGDRRAEMGALNIEGVAEGIFLKTRLYPKGPDRGLGMRGLHVLKNWHSVVVGLKGHRGHLQRTVVVNAGGTLVRATKEELDELIPSDKDKWRIREAKRNLLNCTDAEKVDAVVQELDTMLRWTVHSAAVAIAWRKTGSAAGDDT